MKVLKFGGTSVGSIESISQVLNILKSNTENGVEYAVVFSAMGGLTNLLISMSEKAASKDQTYAEELHSFQDKHFEVIRALIKAQDQSSILAHVKSKVNELEDVLQGVYLIGELSKRSLDFILSHGERINVYIMSELAKLAGIDAHFVDAREIIKTDSNFGAAKIDFKITNKNIQDLFKNNSKTHFVTGFVSSDSDGNTTTLGRGGSDYTAAVFAAAINASETEIWTDVDGVMTADPRKVKNAFSLTALSYNEAMEMSHFGAKVIYPPTLQPVFTKKIPIRIRNTFNPSFEGTLISKKSGPPNQMRVKGISSISDIDLLTLQGSGMIGVTGVSARLFSCLAHHQVNIILITQASSEHSITFAVSPEDTEKAEKAINAEFFYEIEAKRIDRIQIRHSLSIVAIIGANMMKTAGISGRMFSSLGNNGINIIAIAQGSSELNISTVIESKDLSKALNALHDAYFLGESKTLNVFMVGPGLIGATLLKQIEQQAAILKEKMALQINVVAIANSKFYIADDEGLDLNKWREELADSKHEMTFRKFVDLMKELNLPNSVFVDNTSNKEIAKFYEEILSNAISIVTPNKIANSGSFKQYEALKTASQQAGSKFLYETNVGAGLPVINTLQGLMHSGDDVVKIEGVLSGSLSYIFNTYDGSTTFKDIVLKAKENGFTEPDPRDDLNGMDVARKILILSREAGYPLEPKDIKVKNILPKSCIQAPTVDQFLEELEKADGTFKKLIEKAHKEGKKLCFIASMENGKAVVQLESVDSTHPFYSLSGSDNMISYTTDRYLSNPLVIKGPGAGAEVTAAGVFADMIKVSTER